MVFVSVKDVGMRAGVSFQTVSKVLNGKGSVSPETRVRILEAAEALGYVPNVLARGVVARGSHTLGIIASDFGDSVLSQFVVGAEREAQRRGHGTLISTIDTNGANAEQCLRLLLERRVAGVLLAAPQTENDLRIVTMLRGRVPAVGVHPIAGGGIPVVDSDHIQIGALATGHLLERGHRRIGSVIGATTRSVTHRRLGGYRQALEQMGIRFDQGLVEEGHWEIEGGYAATRRLLERAPDVTAIFAQNDTMAVGVLSALHDLRRRVPDDCAVVGCDDIPFAAHTIPPLTTVRIPFIERGEVAVRLLLDSIADGAAAPERTVMPAVLVPRASTGG